MSNFLAVDTSSKYLTVLAQKGEKRAVSYQENCAMQHSVVLMGEIEKVLASVELAPEECDFFAAVTGPGSFTGIRIGISCIKGFASALNKEARGVTSFDMLAYNVNGDTPFAVAIYALHDCYYVCGYSQGKIDIPPTYLTYDEAAALNRHVYGFEDLPFPVYTKLNPKTCLYGAVTKCTDGELSALYVKKCQAEEEREKRGESK